MSITWGTLRDGGKIFIKKQKPIKVEIKVLIGFQIPNSDGQKQVQVIVRKPKREEGPGFVR
ncbi:hypothetical protein C1H46_031638 [Malus baccata]|uniref:Uncharacterized protein n=1 Tax=Malus baccata TaxID=106549 RepID=A0A540L8J1_MALBA|nr:hypothetical protein C1H46_031638 [Malus baccata]